MQIPRLVWHRRHNVAALHVSFGRRIWETRDLGDMLLGYNAVGRLTRVVLLDPAALLDPQASPGEAVERVTTLLLRRAQARQTDLEVLQSALERARRP